MKKPVNFKKIDDMTFATRTGSKYKFSTNDIDPELWVFRQPDTTNYVLAFVMDWQFETYQIKTAKNGDGRNWIGTLHSGNYSRETMRTLDSFIQWVNYRIEMFETAFDKL